MSSQREWSADDYPTRRQLRTAAARAEAEDSATDEETTGSHTSSSNSSSTSSSSSNSSTSADPGTTSTSSSSSADPGTSYPSRRQLRAQERARGRRPASSRSSGASKHPRRWLPRVAVLGALGALTTVVPLTGVALPSSSVDTVADVPLAESSALEVFSAGGTQISTEASAALAADPLASLRSMVSTSRSSDRTTECGRGAMEANGMLASEVEYSPPEIVMPLAQGSYHYTSGYGNRSLFGGSFHAGLDMAAAAGTPIHSVAEGTVVHAGAGKDGRSSMLVIIEHEVDGEKFWTWYVHMYPGGVYVSEGQHVTAGEVIGAVGSYGNSTGPHLHFEVHTDEDLNTVDPKTWLETSDAAPLTGDTLQCSDG